MIALAFPPRRLLAMAFLVLAAGCVSVPRTLDVRIEVKPQGAIRPVNIRVERVGETAVVRGSVYAGPGYRPWQPSHLLIEILTPDQRSVFTQPVAFRPQPIPRRARGRAYSHFSIELPVVPPPGSLLRVMPTSGPMPTPTPFR